MAGPEGGREGGRVGGGEVVLVLVKVAVETVVGLLLLLLLVVVVGTLVARGGAMVGEGVVLGADNAPPIPPPPPPTPPPFLPIPLYRLLAAPVENALITLFPPIPAWPPNPAASTPSSLPSSSSDAAARNSSSVTALCWNIPLILISAVTSLTNGSACIFWRSLFSTFRGVVSFPSSGPKQMAERICKEG